MIIKSQIKNYEVNIVENLPKATDLSVGKNVLYVIDANVYRLYPQLFTDIDLEQIYILEAKEENKTIDCALEICEKFTALSAKKNAVLVSYGGGITQDITGFAANILYRGIRWIFVPTTLLAACDSCIGSKTSLNFKSYKNLLGTFYPPDQIMICSAFFNTLTDSDIKSGLGEVIKFNVMSGYDSLVALENSLEKLIHLDQATVNRFLVQSLDFKKPFVENDEFDKKERILLNFAHTFGHALEVSSHYKIPHGTGVAMGMLMANFISTERGMLKEELAHRIEKLCLPILPQSLNKEWFAYAMILQAIRKDKKQINSNLTAILLNHDFELEIIHDLKEDELKAAIDYLTSFLCF